MQVHCDLLPCPVFNSAFLPCRAFTFECGYVPYVRLMKHYTQVTSVYTRLKPLYQKVFLL